jgi:hypothetical protein
VERPECQTCPFWNHDYETEKDLDPEYSPMGTLIADCRRFPPVRSNLDKFRGCGRDEQASRLLTAGDGDRADWMRTEATDWCGEHPGFAAWLLEQPNPFVRKLAHPVYL